MSTAAPTSTARLRPSSAGARRLNALLGIVVPSLLLVYAAFAYHIVVVEYAFRHLHISARTFVQDTKSSSWISLAHILLLWVATQYSRVSRPPPPLRHFDPPLPIQHKQVIFESDEKGEPLRCYRDDCNGRWKPPRTRHCGTCRTCRPGFDHHCVWFNADISAPYNIRPFLLTTLYAMLLLVHALRPIAPIAWRHACLIWSWASTSPTIHRLWWQHRWNWIGGPWTRYGWGFILGAWLYPSHEPSAIESDSAWLARPNLGLVLLIFFAACIGAICLGLLLSTLLALSRGDLTIDTARRKLASRARASAPTQLHTEPGYLPLGTSFFWVPLKEKKENQGVVVACPPHEQPYAVPGSRFQNLKMMLAMAPFDRHDWLSSWPMSGEWKEELYRRAAAIAEAGAAPSEEKS
ncbi:hypothetical protein V8E36_000619 [Tilletia maclaganii]